MINGNGWNGIVKATEEESSQRRAASFQCSSSSSNRQISSMYKSVHVSEGGVAVVDCGCPPVAKVFYLCTQSVCVLVGVNGSAKNYKYVRRMYVYVCERVRENIYCSNSSKVRLILFV